MRVLRCTIWMDPTTPMTTVVRDSDVVDSLESVRLKYMEFDRGNAVPHFLTTDIFEMEDGGIEDATMVAVERIDPDREANQAVLFFWCISIMAGPLARDGAIIAPDNAPLSVDEIAGTLDQVAISPPYEEQEVSIPAEDGTLIRLQEGEVKIG